MKDFRIMNRLLSIFLIRKAAHVTVFCIEITFISFLLCGNDWKILHSKHMNNTKTDKLYKNITNVKNEHTNFSFRLRIRHHIRRICGKLSSTHLVIIIFLSFALMKNDYYLSFIYCRTGVTD